MESFDTIIILFTTTDFDKFKEDVLKLFNDNAKYIELGKRHLAYEIHGQGEGFYIEIVWNGKIKDVGRLDEFCRCNNNIMKFITVKREGGNYIRRIEDEYNR